MKKALLALLLLFILMSFNSCIVIKSVLGIEDECNYPDCDRTCVENCNYCIIHCNSYNVPENFKSKTGKSINDQLKQYREEQRGNINQQP